MTPESQAEIIRHQTTFTTVFLLLLSFSVRAQQVKVTLVNNSTESLDSVIVNNLYIGTIGAQKDTTVFFENFQIADDIPLVKASANLWSQKIYTAERTFECIPETYLKTSGELIMNLSILQNTNGLYLHSESLP